MKPLKPTLSRTLWRTLAAAMVAPAILTPAALALTDPAAKFDAMDTNGDAVVTEAEYIAHAAETERMDPEGAKLRFEVLAGQDRTLTAEEFASAMSVLEPGTDGAGTGTADPQTGTGPDNGPDLGTGDTR